MASNPTPDTGDSRRLADEDRRSKPAQHVHWEPQPGPQEMLLACPVDDIGFGGARGGGKTAGMLGDFLFHESQHGKHANGLFLRRSYPELDEVIRQADALFIGWKKIVEGPTYRAPSGARLSLRALQRDSDADKFLGHSYTWIGVDEATHWPSPEPLDKLRACLRAAEACLVIMVIFQVESRCRRCIPSRAHPFIPSYYLRPRMPSAPDSKILQKALWQSALYGGFIDKSPPVDWIWSFGELRTMRVT